jgi:hypothetical protein
MSHRVRGFTSASRGSILAAVLLLFTAPARPDDNKQKKARSEHIRSAPASGTHTSGGTVRHGTAVPARSGGTDAIRHPAGADARNQTVRPPRTSGADTRANHSHGTPAVTGRTVTPNRGGSRVISGPSRNVTPNRVYRNPSGTEAHLRPDGRVQSVHARGMMITHGPGGRIVVNRPDRTVVVTNRAGRGYVQRPFAYRGHELVHRTYYVRGVSYARYYRPYTYHGVVLYGYVPVRYYAPAFYGWAYHPWSVPVSYSWGWGGSPWAGYYRGYFAPAPFYRSPAFWLVDFLIAEQLMEAYQERAARNARIEPQNFAGSELTPEIKQAIADEVQHQLALENQESQMAARNQMGDPASSGIPRLLSDNKSHVFVVSYNLEVTSSEGQLCGLARGDVLQLNSRPPADASVATVQVIASKGTGCPRGSSVSVELADLEDMHNHMRESVGKGMSELQTHAGQGGLPALPAAAAAAPAAAPFADVAPPPDPNVASTLSQQVQEADRVEHEVLTEAKVSGPAAEPAADAAAAPPAAPQTATIALGQSPAEVIAILGNPSQIVKLGTKEIYRYKDVKVTFVSGKVTDIE